jgi:phosphoglycolate phosphatase-like HAD superfamily hydrolase
MQRPSYTCMIFDLDGVIADSRFMYVHAIATAMRDAGIAADEKEIQAAITPDVTVWVNAMRQRFGDEATRGVIDRARKFVAQEGWKIVEPGASIKPLLAFLEGRGTRTALVSNAPSDYARKVLERFEIRSHFEIAISCPERKMTKQQGIELLLKETGTKPSEALYICDTAMDVVHAGRAGVGAVVVFSEISWDYPYRDRVEKENPFMIVESIQDVMEWLKRSSD